MAKRKSDESKFVQFAMTAPVEQVRSAIETMKAIVEQRSPKAATKVTRGKAKVAPVPPVTPQDEQQERPLLITAVVGTPDAEGKQHVRFKGE